MSNLVLILVTGLGLGALYFLAASGLSLIYGLMGVLNFAHGAFMMAGAYAAWMTMQGLGAGASEWLQLAAGSAVAIVVGVIVGVVVEVILIRPLYRRHIQQVLVTVGLSLAAVAVAAGHLGPDPGPSRSRHGCVGRPRWPGPCCPTTASSTSSSPSRSSAGCSPCSTSPDSGS